MAITVVIAEGCTLVREGLVQLMEQFGIEAIEASSVGETFILAQQKQPDVVLLNRELVAMVTLRRFKRRALTQFVLYSPFRDDVGSVLEMVRAGVSGYIMRDTAVERLPEVVKHVASGEISFPEEMITKLCNELAAEGSVRPAARNRAIGGRSPLKQVGD